MHPNHPIPTPEQCFDRLRQSATWTLNANMDIQATPIDPLLDVLSDPNSLSDHCSDLIFFPIHLRIEHQNYYFLSLLHPWHNEQHQFSPSSIQQNCTALSISEALRFKLQTTRLKPPNCMYLTSELHFNESISTLQNPYVFLHNVVLDPHNNTGVFFDPQERLQISLRLATEYIPYLAQALSTFSVSMSVLDTIGADDRRMHPLESLDHPELFNRYWSTLYEHAFEKLWLNQNTPLQNNQSIGMDSHYLPQRAKIKKL